MLFQGSFKGVYTRFQGSLKGALRVFIGNFSEISRVLQLRLKGVSSSFNGVSRVFERSSNKLELCWGQPPSYSQPSSR